MKKYKLTEKWWSWTGTGKNVGCKQFCNFVMSKSSNVLENPISKISNEQKMN